MSKYLESCSTASSQLSSTFASAENKLSGEDEDADVSALNCITEYAACPSGNWGYFSTKDLKNIRASSSLPIWKRTVKVGITKSHHS